MTSTSDERREVAARLRKARKAFGRRYEDD